MSTNFVGEKKDIWNSCNTNDPVFFKMFVPPSYKKRGIFSCSHIWQIIQEEKGEFFVTIIYIKHHPEGFCSYFIQIISPRMLIFYVKYLFLVIYVI